MASADAGGAVLPRNLDRDFGSAVGLTANEYLTLMSLSEAPGRELRMTDLAEDVTCEEGACVRKH